MKARALLVSLLLAFSFVIGGAVITPVTTYAKVSSACEKSSWFLGLPPWYKYLTVTPDASSKGCSITGPKDTKGNFDIAKALPLILFAIFEIILRISGLAAVGFMIYGGIQYVLSQGEPDRTKASKNTIINAFVGLAIVMSATAIVNLLGNTLA